MSQNRSRPTVDSSSGHINTQSQTHGCSQCSEPDGRHRRATMHSLGMRPGEGKHRDMELGEKGRTEALQAIIDHSFGHVPGAQEDHQCWMLVAMMPSSPEFPCRACLFFGAQCLFQQSHCCSKHDQPCQDMPFRTVMPNRKVLQVTCVVLKFLEATFKKLKEAGAI